MSEAVECLYTSYMLESKALLEKYLTADIPVEIKERLVVLQAANIEVIRLIHRMLNKARPEMLFSEFLKNVSEAEKEGEKPAGKGGNETAESASAPS